MLTVRRLLAVGIVAATAAYVGLVVPNASAGTTGFGPTTVSAGRLELKSTASSLTVTWYRAGVPDSSETVTLDRADKCLINNAAGDDEVGKLARLLFIRPASSAGTRPLGYVSNGLGTRDNNTCNTSNGTFGVDETMELTLGSELLNQGIAIDYARLDLEGKFGTSLGYTTRKTTAATPLPGVSVNPGWTGSDNGSDSGSSDNRDVTLGNNTVGDNFVALSVFPTGDLRGQISLEAGGDWGADAELHRTTLYLVQQTPGYEYDLGCGNIHSETFGGTAPTVYPKGATISRYDTGPPSPRSCLAVPADISSSGGNVLLRKTTKDSTGGEQNPRIRFEIVWVVPTTPQTGDPFQRLVDLDGDLTGLGTEPAQYCTSYTPAAGALDPDLDGIDGFIDPGHAGTAEHPVDDRFALLPGETTGKLPWCVIADIRTPGMVGTTPVIFQRMVWDGYGDPKFF